jgi:hypothetical protein
MRALATRTILTLVLLAAGARAQEIQVSETKLTFQLPHDETQQRSFRVDAKPLPALRVTVAGDLVEAATGLVILGGNVKVASSERNEEQGFETFTVTIGGATRAGHYLGRLGVRPEQGAGKAIDLDVTVLPASTQVDAEVNSKSPILAARQGWLDLPFAGSPPSKGDVTAKLPIYFVNTAGSDAWVEYARVLGMLATGGGALPSGAVRVVSQPSLPVSGKDGKPLEVGVAPANVDAGEYKGTLEVKVRNQETLLQLPLTARVKHGPLVPLLTLVLGILAALLFTWWNADGKATHDLVKSLEVLEADVREGRGLQAEDREEASRLIAAAMQAVEARAPFTDVKAKADAAQKHVADGRAAADQLLSQTLQPLREKAETRVEGRSPGARLRQELTGELDRVEKSVREGGYARLKDAEDRLAELRPGIEAFAAIVDKLREVPADKRDEVVRQMDAADTLTALRQVLLDAGVAEVPPAGRGRSFVIDTVETEAAPVLPRLGLSRRLQLSLGAAAVALITYFFVLAIGFLSLYVKNDTFGADPMSYVSLFLWGATVEAVRGKTVTFTGLKTISEA